MSCKLPYKTAEANAKSYLRTKGVIDKYLNIIDYPNFVRENRRLTEAGIKNYAIEGDWFYSEDNNTKAIPNKELFKQVDNINKIPDPKIFEKKLEELNKDKFLSETHKYIFGSENNKIKVEQDFVILEEDKNNNLNQIREKLFNNNLTNQSANQFLRNALYNLDLNEDSKDLVKNLLTTRANIKFVNKSVLSDPNTYAQYDYNKREIQLNRDILGSGNL